MKTDTWINDANFRRILTFLSLRFGLILILTVLYIKFDWVLTIKVKNVFLFLVYDWFIGNTTAFIVVRLCSFLFLFFFIVILFSINVCLILFIFLLLINTVSTLGRLLRFVRLIYIILCVNITITVCHRFAWCRLLRFVRLIYVILCINITIILYHLFAWCRLWRLVCLIWVLLVINVSLVISTFILRRSSIIAFICEIIISLIIFFLFWRTTFFSICGLFTY